MNKTVDERLFEQIMRTPHAVRRAMIDDRFGGPFGEDGPRGPHGCGPMDGPGPKGPHGCGPMDGPGPGAPHGCEHGPMHPHGPMTGPHPMRGPRPHRHMRGPGGAFAQERMLDVISRFEGGVRQKELTEELKIRPSSVSETISKLEHDGYVKRKVDPDDKRATLITLTEVGEARAAELADERGAKLSKAFEPLTDEEKEQLIVLLAKLSDRG